MELGSESQKLEISTYITLPWTPLCRCKNRPQKALQEAPWSQDHHSQFLPLALLLQDQLEMYTANKQTNKRNRNNLKNSNLEQKTWWVRDQRRDRTEGKTCVPVCDPAPNTARKAQGSNHISFKLAILVHAAGVHLLCPRPIAAGPILLAWRLTS